MTELHWLTVTWASIWLILFESGLVPPEEIRDSMGVEPDEVSKMPEAWQLITSDHPDDLVKGLHMLSNHVLDWDALGPLLGNLLEGLFVSDYSVQQVVRTLEVICQKVEAQEFVFAPQVIDDFRRDTVEMSSFPARLHAIENGKSTETLDELRANVDEWLMGYGSP